LIRRWIESRIGQREDTPRGSNVFTDASRRPPCSIYWPSGSRSRSRA